MKKYRYWGPFKQRWFSICSIHFEGDENCNMCQSGHWHNVYYNKFSNWLYTNHYPIWFWWNNRK